MPKEDPKDQKSHFESGLDPAETRHAAAHWAEWAAHDVAHFLRPLQEATGLTRTEALLYLVSERLAQLIEGGLSVKLHATHEVKELPPEGGEEEEWKR